MFGTLAEMPAAQQAVTIAFMLSAVVGFIAGIGIVIYAIRLPFHGKSENLHGWFRFNPFNAVFAPGKLSPKGLVLRKRLLISVACFLACLLLGVFLGLLAKALAQG